MIISNGIFDILWAVQQILTNLLLTMFYQHVKGHQDEVKSTLNLLETLNLIMDKRAGEYQTYMELSVYYEYFHLYWYSSWHCYINNLYVTSNLDFHIKDVIYKQKMNVHLCQCKHYSEKAFECIDWYAIGKASKNLTL